PNSLPNDAPPPLPCAQEVKKPMDLSTMRKKLLADRYSDRRSGVGAFMEDIDWIRYNCQQFNGVRTWGL
ncbi:unnamed protein product, partial [Discosporangium mesarthrocarpum]